MKEAIYHLNALLLLLVPRVPFAKARVLILLLSIFFFINSDLLGASSDLPLETLLDIATLNDANLQKIKTWQGEAVIEDYNSTKEQKKITHSTARFYYDARRAAKRWDWLWKSTDVLGQDGKIAENVTLNLQKNCISLKDKFVMLGPHSRGNEEETRALLIYAPASRGQTGYLSDDFDPTFFLKARECDIAEDVRWFHDAKKQGKKIGQFDVKTVDNNIAVSDILRGNLNEWLFDPSQGMMIIEYVSDDGNQLRWEYTWEWETKTGVYVPRTFSAAQYQYGNGKLLDSPILKRTARFVKNEVNAPLDARMFEIDSIGIKKGDHVSDTRVGISYRYGEAPAENSPLAGKGVIIVVVALTGIIVAFFIFRFSKANAKTK